MGSLLHFSLSDLLPWPMYPAPWEGRRYQGQSSLNPWDPVTMKCTWVGLETLAVASVWVGQCTETLINCQFWYNELKKYFLSSIIRLFSDLCFPSAIFSSSFISHFRRLLPWSFPSLYHPRHLLVSTYLPLWLFSPYPWSTLTSQSICPCRGLFSSSSPLIPCGLRGFARLKKLKKLKKTWIELTPPTQTLFFVETHHWHDRTLKS